MKYHAPLAGSLLAVVLLIGVPLFLRTPVWVDVTYHDISARNVLQGGVHYRDVFETNLPGMVWLHCLVRPVVGWSHEAIRVVDLGVFTAIALALARLLRLDGRTRAERLWFLCTASLFYLYESDFIHVQRDGWMLLPAVLALLVSVRRATQPSMRWAFLEGCLWGGAVWIKPHVLVPALFVWLVAWRFTPWRDGVRSTLGLFAGGLLLGALGCAWLIGTDTWKPMWEVMLHWNGEYYEWSWADTFYKIQLVGVYFAPFSLLHLVAIPAALYALIRRDATVALLAALYLGWLAQATLIQKMFDYAQAPPMLLAIAVLATTRLPVGPIVLVWCVLGSLAHTTCGEQAWFKAQRERFPATWPQVVPDHRLGQLPRLERWPRCWYDSSWELKDDLAHYGSIPSVPNWTDLHTIADYLRTQDVHDADVIGWHDSTHPLYLDLGIRGGIRFPHVITAMRLKSKVPTIRAETFNSPARFVVSDLVALSHLGDFEIDFPAGPTNRLPTGFPDAMRDIYPWNQPVVYRVGRYVVHRIDTPRGEILFPFR